MDATVHVGIGCAVKLLHHVDDLQRFLCCGTIVKIYQGLPVCHR